jgi:hypothetical protein
MKDVPQSPVEAIEQTPVEPERFLDIVTRVCEQHGFPRRAKPSSPEEQNPKR